MKWKMILLHSETQCFYENVRDTDDLSPGEWLATRECGPQYQLLGFQLASEYADDAVRQLTKEEALEAIRVSRLDTVTRVGGRKMPQGDFMKSPAMGLSKIQGRVHDSIYWEEATQMKGLGDLSILEQRIKDSGGYVNHGTTTGRISSYPDPSAKRDAMHEPKPVFPPPTIFDTFPEFEVRSHESVKDEHKPPQHSLQRALALPDAFGRSFWKPWNA